MALLTEPIVGAHIFLFDGICGLCNGFVDFTVPKDRAGKFQFASLQSDFSHKLLAQYKINPDDLNTVYVVADYGLPTQRVLSKSDAAMFVLNQLGGIWSVLSIFRLVPKFIRDATYQLVASNRYKVFGKKSTCRIPTPDERSRFIEV